MLLLQACVDGIVRIQRVDAKNWKERGRRTQEVTSSRSESHFQLRHATGSGILWAMTLNVSSWKKSLRERWDVCLEAVQKKILPE